jgi:hypothetical protein
MKPQKINIKKNKIIRQHQLKKRQKKKKTKWTLANFSKPGLISKTCNLWNLRLVLNQEV